MRPRRWLGAFPMKAVTMQITLMSLRYTVVFEQADFNWAAYVPDLPGCITTGKTLDEVESNIREAIAGHLSTLREFGYPVPDPTSVAREVEISSAA